MPSPAAPIRTPRPPRLSLRGIGKRFGPTWVLREVSLEVGPGEVHAVVGLNGSGKSTLMRAVYGAHQPTEGEIFLDGQPCRFRSPREALARGVAAVPQELPVVPELSVAENIFLGMLPARASMIRTRAAQHEAETILAHLHAGLDVRRPVGSLDLAGQQLVVMARALVRRAGVIVLDEPTSALPGRAAERLREVIRTLRADGEAIMFTSQRLDDVLDIADEVTVLRDGSTVAQGPAAGFTVDSLIHSMVSGRALGPGGQVPGPGASAPVPLAPVGPAPVAPAPVAPAPVGPGSASAGLAPASAHRPSGRAAALLSVRNLHAGRVRDISFDVEAGELVGLFGLPGSGASDVLRAIFAGAPTWASTGRASPALGAGRAEVGRPGTVRLNGAELPPGVRRRIGQGLAYVTGDRQTALVGELSVAANIALPAARYVGRRLRPGRERRVAAAQIAALRIQPPAPDARVSELSGGNQQKVILARWLAGQPLVWLLDDPTRGVDAQAQADIHQIIRDRVRAGACGLIYSSDPRELHGICDRGMLVAGGRVTAEIDPGRLDADEIGGFLEGRQP